MKKIFSIALVFALALSVVGSTVSAQSMTYAFNTNLTMGSRGADVVMLQSFLESKGLLTMPAGVAKGYFGGLTKSAVVAYQISKGVTPTSGFFGPLTRAVANSDSTTTTTTTTTTSTVAGCVAGAMFSSTTGQPCVTSNTTTTTTTSGVEGNLDVRLAAAPANNANVQTSNDVPVYGVELKARLGDVAVQTIDLQISSTVSSSAENPGTLINTIKVWDGSTVLATLPVNTSTFTKDSNSVYYVRLAGLNFMVPKDVTKTLTVSFSTNSGIDSDRTVVIDGYGTNSLRAVSGNGVSSFYSLDALTRTHTFKKPGTATLTLSSATSPLRSQNYRINPDNGVQYMPVLTFNVKAETGDTKIENVYASTTWSGAVAPSTLYLYDGSTLLASKNVVTSGTSINFDNLSIVVSKDTTKTLTVKADLPATTASGSYSSTTVSRVVFEKPNGTTADASGSQVYGVNQYAYTAAPQYVLVGTPTISKVSNQNGSTTEMTATFTFNVTALGGAMTKPTAADFGVYAATNTTNLIAASVGTPVTIPNNNISDGSTAQVTVTATIGSTQVTHSGQYGFVVASTTWTVGSTGPVSQTYGTDDWKTPATSYFSK
jgi:hypothetical protein